MSEVFDLTTQRYLQIRWSRLNLQEAKQAAYDFMDGWDWQEKVPYYKQVVEGMTTVNAISQFMLNCTVKGYKYKAQNARKR